MKQLLTIFAILFTFSFISCTGFLRNTAKENDGLSPAAKQIKKGTAWYNRGCYKRSLNSFLKAHELFSGADNLSGVAMSLNNIGNVYRITGDFNTATAFFEESFNMYKDIKDYHGSVQALSNMAATYLVENKIGKASKTVKQAEKIASNKGILFLPLLRNKGILFMKQKKFAEAETIFKKVLHKTRQSNSFEFATINFVLGKLMIKTNLYDKAIKYLDKAIDSDRKTGCYHGLADDLAEIGKVRLKQGMGSDAAKYLKRSAKIYALMGDKEKANTIMVLLENTAKKENIDFSVTKYFVNRWLNGEILGNSCY